MQYLKNKKKLINLLKTRVFTKNKSTLPVICTTSYGRNSKKASHSTVPVQGRKSHTYLLCKFKSQTSRPMQGASSEAFIYTHSSQTYANCCPSLPFLNPPHSSLCVSVSELPCEIAGNMSWESKVTKMSPVKAITISFQTTRVNKSGEFYPLNDTPKKSLRERVEGCG